MGTKEEAIRFLNYCLLRVVVYSLSAFYSLLIIIGIIRNYFTSSKDEFWKVKPRPLPPACLNAGNHSYIQLKNIKLHYVEAGDRDKPLMLFLHGFPEFWYSWRNQIKEFSKDYWTVAVDLRGYGDSEKPSGVKYYKYFYIVEDIKNLIEALGKKKCILVGHDWGGLITWKFLDVYQNYVDCYVVMNAPHPKVLRKQMYTNFNQFKKSWYMFAFQMPFLPEIFLRQKDMAFLEKAFKGRTESRAFTPEDLEAYKFTFGKPGAFVNPVNYYRANLLHSHIFKKKVGEKEESVPGLFLFGNDDVAIETINVEETSKIVPNLTTEIISEGSHFVQQDQPDRVNQAMRKFLKGVYNLQEKHLTLE